MNMFIIIVIACIINAFMDAIDHSKRSRGVFDLWHIAKAILLGLLILPHFLGHGWGYFFKGLFVTMTGWFVIFECCYSMFLILNVAYWDDKVHIPLLGKVMGYEKWRR